VDNLQNDKAPDHTDAAGSTQAVVNDADKKVAKAQDQSAALVQKVKTQGEVNPAETVKEAAKEASKETVPEKYADFAVPAGVEVDPTLLTEFHDLARKTGLSQEKAQGVFDLGVKLLEKITGTAAKSQAEQSEKWMQDAINDPEIGGDRLKYAVENSKAFLKKVLGDNGRSAFFELLRAKGLENNPALLRLLSIGWNAVKEDASPRGQAGANKSADFSEIYPSLAGQ
jgi:hypothetical protein